MPSETVELRGHIIDSLLLPKVLDEIMTLGGTFEIVDLAVGHTREDESRATIRVAAPDAALLDTIIGRIGQHGAVPVHEEDARLVPADCDGAFPDGFYCTTHFDTWMRRDGAWIAVEQPARMFWLKPTTMQMAYRVSATGGVRVKLASAATFTTIQPPPRRIKYVTTPSAAPIKGLEAYHNV